MQIQWYPGHMHKARKAIRESLPKVNMILEVIDARIPFSSENPMLAELRGNKPCIKVMTKTDLADPERTQEWVTYFEQEEDTETVLTITTKQPETIQQLPELIRNKLSLYDRTIHTMIVGIPNAGKSTLINILAGRSIAKTGNEPAITKAQQQIKLENEIVLSDTPGVLWPNVENKNSGFRLAATGAIRDTAMEYPDVAFFLIEYLIRMYPDFLRSRFEINLLPETEIELLEIIGQKRGCLRTGHQVDLEKVSRLVINEFRSGVIGRITLETPEDMNRERIEVEKIRAEKLAKKLARTETRKNKKKKL